MPLNIYDTTKSVMAKTSAEPSGYNRINPSLNAWGIGSKDSRPINTQGSQMFYRRSGNKYLGYNQASAQPVVNANTLVNQRAGLVQAQGIDVQDTLRTSVNQNNTTSFQGNPWLANPYAERKEKYGIFRNTTPDAACQNVEGASCRPPMFL